VANERSPTVAQRDSWIASRLVVGMIDVGLYHMHHTDASCCYTCLLQHGLFVLGTLVSPTKMAEPVSQFGSWTYVNPVNDVLDGDRESEMCLEF